jgi:dipeptidyl aminopeptidase/acylaminoacyl peptidase
MLRKDVASFTRFASRVLAVTAGLVLIATAAPLPVSHLTALPTFDRPIISPNGKYMALANLVEGQQALTLLDLATMQPKPLAGLGYSRLTNWWWKNDEWLLLLIEGPDGARDFRAIEIKSPETKRRPLVASKNLEVLDVLPSEPEEVLVAVSYREMARLNVRTGKMRVVEKSLGHWIDWNINLRGEAIGGISYNYLERKVLLNYRAAPGSAWQSREIGTFDSPNLQILGAADDGRRFLAIDQTPEREARVVCYDAATGQSEPVFTPPGVDPDGVLKWGDLNVPVVAIAYETDRPRLHFLDAGAARTQQQIDTALPATTNVVVSQSADGMRLIVAARSELDPGTYYLLDRTTGRLMKLASRYDNWNPNQMGRSEAFTFAARDGLTIHGRLVLPPSGVAPAGPPPLIVLTGQYINGLRVRANFDPLVQLLATRGYAVAQIDVRGTHGYGREFTKRGDLQIGTGMAQDLVDGVTWLSGQGKIDTQRVILFARSFGGWMGTNALASSKVFAGWVNWAIPMETTVNPESLILSDLSRKDSLALMGGIFAAERYLEQIAPIKQLPKIELPSFHRYGYYRGFLGSDLAQRHYRKDPERHVFRLEEDAQTLAERDAITISSHQQMLAYLAKNFPTELNSAR